MTKTKTEKVEKTADGVKLTVSNAKGTSTIEADKVLVAIGVTGNIEQVIGPDAQARDLQGPHQGGHEVPDQRRRASGRSAM